MIFAARGVPEGALLVLVALVLLLLTLFRRDFGGALGDVASTLLGVVYIAGPFALGRELHVVDPHWLFFVLVLNWVGDSVAFFFGKRFGRGKMAPTISPNKTWVGAAASLVLAVIVGTGYLYYFQPSGVAIWVAVLLSIWVNVAAQFGDLAESALKRSADVKDSGGMLPGHGGNARPGGWPAVLATRLLLGCAVSLMAWSADARILHPRLCCLGETGQPTRGLTSAPPLLGAAVQ